MSCILYPDRVINEIYDIPFDLLRENGIKAIVSDLDDTLTPYYDTSVHPRLTEWLERAKAEGIEICILSNGKKKRIEPFCRSLGLRCVAMAMKPLPFGYFRAKRMLGLRRMEMLCVGDQIFTDILGGNLAGFNTVLVEPIAYKTGKAEIKKRQLEKPYRREGKKRARKSDIRPGRK